jgi:hypothetical protein
MHAEFGLLGKFEQAVVVIGAEFEPGRPQGQLA